MQGGIKLSVIVSLAALVSIASAQEAGTVPGSALPPDIAGANALPLPYVAQITADNVYIRSGPGTNHYHCGKLNKTDTVTVVASYFSWSRIDPPVGSFSWISRQYVKIDPDNPSVGIVTGNAVLVYVGAEDRDPIRCTSTQLKLNRDEKVELLGELKSEYYKIAPPAGAYRWVSTKYTKPLYAVGKPPTPPPSVAPAPPSDTNVVVVTPTVSGEAAKLQAYYALQEQLKAEQTKPMAQQDYTNLKKAFLALAEDKEAGKAARYADFALKQIQRFELALEVAKAVKLQDAQLKQDLDNINKARAKRLAEIQDIGKFAVVGRLLTSTIYGPGRYRVVDDSNRNLCIALPIGSASSSDLSKFIGRKVGLVGTIEPHLQTKGAMVRFTQVVEVK